jgi:hypothetical protein
MGRVAVVCAVALWLGQRQGQTPQDDGFSPRFPRESARPDAGAPPPTALPPVPPPVGAGAAACTGVPPQQQLSCPLSGRVTAIEPISQGARLVVRRGRLSADGLRAQLLCQLSLAGARAELTPACSFLAPGMDVIVRTRGRSALAVELLAPGDDAAAGILRQRLQTAFPRARR